jgi:hypothetical protein
MPRAPVVERPPILIPRLGGSGARDEPYVMGRDHAAQAVALGARTLAALERGERHAFVATDLLWLDGQPLFDVPLLERKRLLEAVLEESYLVRVSAFVRPSAVITLVTWGTIGFRDLVWKAANSRYRPGEANEDWAVGRAPQGPVAARPAPPPR